MIEEERSENPFEWSRSESILFARAYVGLMNGDLDPLARYIRAGLPVNRDLAELLASSIDGLGRISAPSILPRYRIRMTGKPGQRSISQDRDSHLQKLEIGYYIWQDLSSANRGEFEGVILDAMGKFSRSRTVVTDAYTYFRHAMDNANGDFLGDLAQLPTRNPDE